MEDCTDIATKGVIVIVCILLFISLLAWLVARKKKNDEPSENDTNPSLPENDEVSRRLSHQLSLIESDVYREAKKLADKEGVKVAFRHLDAVWSRVLREHNNDSLQ